MSQETTHEIHSGCVELAISDGTSMPLYTSQPVEAGDYPGILVFQEAFGVNAHIRDLTERFARYGFVAAAPALFHRTDATFEGSYTDFGPVAPHMAALTDEGQSADIQASYDWLTSPEGGGVTKVVSKGYCMGGRTSFLANTLVPLRAAASYYGGGIAPSERPNFSPLIEKAADLKAPIMLFWGGADTHIGPDQRSAVEAALTGADKDFAQIVFSKAEHGFFCDARASYNPVAAAEAWALTLSFYEQHLA